MAIIYSEERHEGGAPTVPYERWNAVKHYLKHYANYLYLDFIAKASKDGRERAQARKEMAICEKKMAYWKRHPRYDQAEVTKGVQELKAQWR